MSELQTISRDTVMRFLERALIINFLFEQSTEFDSAMYLAALIANGEHAKCFPAASAAVNPQPLHHEECD